MKLKPWRFRPVYCAVPIAAPTEYLSLCGRSGTEMKPTSSRVLVAVTSGFDSYTHRFFIPPLAAVDYGSLHSCDFRVGVL